MSGGIAVHFNGNSSPKDRTNSNSWAMKGKVTCATHWKKISDQEGAKINTPNVCKNALFCEES